MTQEAATAATQAAPATAVPPPATAVLSQPTDQIIAVRDLGEEFRTLANEANGGEEFMRLSLRKICAAYRVIGFGFRGRIGAKTFQDFAAVPDLDGEHKESLRATISQNLLACQGEIGTFLAGPKQIGPHSLRLVTVATEVAQHEFVGIASFCVLDGPTDRLQLVRAELQGAMHQMLSSIPSSAESAPEETVSTEDQEVDLTARTSRYSGPREFAFALVNSLARRFDCQQVACGLREGDNIVVQAVSGKDTFKASSPGIVDIQQAMEETLDAGVGVSSQPHGETTAHNPMPVHTQWATSTRTAVCSYPMLADDECIGVVSLRKDAEVGFSEAELAELESLITPFGPAVELTKRGNRTLVEHLKESGKESWKLAVQPTTGTGRILRIAALLAGLIFLFGWMPFRPMTPCVIVPAKMTQTLAPFDMQLSAVHVRSGDEVQQGQLLVKFDTRELELERASLISQRDQAEVDVRAALVEGDAAAASLAKANASVFQTQLDSINKKISLCFIKAPTNGMVVEAELEKKLGQIFPQGEKVLSFAPMDEFELEIHVPEYNARHIASTQSGSFVSSADPGNKMPYLIESVSGSAELIDGKNVFVAKAKLKGSSEHFRQGMEGFAKTDVGWRPIPWIAFHRIYEYARSSFWF